MNQPISKLLNSDNNIASFTSNQYHYQMNSSDLPTKTKISIIVKLSDFSVVNDEHKTVITLK